MGIDWDRRVHRRSLFNLLGYHSEKIPKAECRIVHNVNIPAREYDHETRTFILRTICVATVKIYPTPANIRKSSKHRVFIVCTCGREIPAGRLHQHVCK